MFAGPETGGRVKAWIRKHGLHRLYGAAKPAPSQGPEGKDKAMSHKMSRDRIEFRPGVYASPSYVYSGNEAHPSLTFTATSEALITSMGVTRAEANRMVRENTLIRCRPSQFARFIVHRHDNGIKCNNIKSLEPRLIEASPCREQPVDVSENPAEHDRR